jgi:hypothetical protein
MTENQPEGVYTQPLKLDKIDPNRIKLRELSLVEKQVGRTLAGEMASGELAMDTMAGLLWVMMLRQDPEATYEQAAEYEVGQLEALFKDEDEGGPPPDLQGPDPTKATLSGGDISTSSSAEEPWKPMPSSSASGV